MNNNEKVYLGDGVYARYDGYNVVLTAENGERATNEIYLEPVVFDLLLDYVERLKMEEAHATTTD